MKNEMVVDGRPMSRGFFRGSVFLHPELCFQYQFPDGWNTWNGGDAVVGLNSEQDAIIKLAVTPAAPPAAVQAFFGQPGIEAVNTAADKINGLPATIGEFVAETGQGTVRGIATFIECGDATYQVTATALSEEFARYNSLLRRSIATFEPLTDHATLTTPVRRAGTRPRRATSQSNSPFEPGPDPIAGSIPWRRRRR